MTQSTPRRAAGRHRAWLALATGIAMAAMLLSARGNLVSAQTISVVFNEVESNGGTPGDWVELYNNNGVLVDLSGYVFKDGDDTHSYVLPSGTTIAGGGFLVLDELNEPDIIEGFDFGLGQNENVRLFEPDGTTLVTSYSYGPHAPTTYGRCPDGTGELQTTAVSTKGAANDCSFDVVINEIESSDGDNPDWVEIFNRGVTEADLSGYIFKDSDDLNSFAIPASTLLAPGAYLVIDGSSGFQFGLGGTDSARLFEPDGTTIVDSHSWVGHASTTYGRCPNGTGEFATTSAPTQAAANDCGVDTSGIVFNEVESNGGTPGDWVEIYNTGANSADLSGFVFKDGDDTHSYVLAAGSIVAANGFLVLHELNAPDITEGFDFGLGQNGESVRLFEPDGTTLVTSYTYGPHAATTYGRCPDGTGEFQTTAVATKGVANDCGIDVVINEIESSDGDNPDWVELFNRGAAAADVSGYVIKDSDDTHVYTIPAATSIAAGGYLVVEDPPLGFGLGGADSVRFFESDGTTLADSYAWAAHAPTTYGRCPNGTGEFGATAAGTKGAANDCGVDASGVIFNEVESNGGTPGDWFELYNTTASAVDLTGYVFKDGDDTHIYVLPASTIIAANGYLVIDEFLSPNPGFNFGLGAPESVRLIAPDGVTLLTSYSWTQHASTTYGRCPNITGEFTTTSGPTRGAANACGADLTALKLNEIESNDGDNPDWVEIFNGGALAADLTGFVLKDNDDTHIYTFPATSLASNGYLVVDGNTLGFGLGGADSARLFAADGTTLVDSYTWATHAVTTYGRCPNGTGEFTTTTAPSLGTQNVCPGEILTEQWPGGSEFVVADVNGQFGGNMSGLVYEGSGSSTPGTLWAVKNGPGTLYQLTWNGSAWVPVSTNGWGAGKLVHYPNGTGNVDAEGVTIAGTGSAGGLYIASERDNNGGGSRLSIQLFDVSGSASELNATMEWNFTSDLPVVGPNLGFEAITWVPNSYLVANGFVDESTGQAYNPANYPNHAGGIFFVGVEADGMMYGFALNHSNGTFTKVASIESGFTGVMGLEFDREREEFWVICDNGCQNRSAHIEIDENGAFQPVRVFERPADMPSTMNNEGFAVVSEAECVAGLKPAFWTDDSATGGNAIRKGSVPCEVGVTITGTVSLEGQADFSGTTVVFGAYTATTNSAGGFTLTVPVGTSGTLVAYRAGYLRAMAAETTISVNSTAASVTLQGGDANGDGTVNIFDLALVAGHFGQSGPFSLGNGLLVPAQAVTPDINGSGAVDIFDLSLTAGSFDLSEPIDWDFVF